MWLSDLELLMCVCLWYFSFSDLSTFKDFVLLLQNHQRRSKGATLQKKTKINSIPCLKMHLLKVQKVKKIELNRSYYMKTMKMIDWLSQIQISVARQNTQFTVPPALDLFYWCIWKPHTTQQAFGFVQRFQWQRQRAESRCSPATNLLAARRCWLWEILLVSDKIRRHDLKISLNPCRECSLSGFLKLLSFIFLWVWCFFWSKVGFQWCSTNWIGSEDKWADVPPPNISVKDAFIVIHYLINFSFISIFFNCVCYITNKFGFLFIGGVAMTTVFQRQCWLMTSCRFLLMFDSLYPRQPTWFWLSAKCRQSCLYYLLSIVLLVSIKLTASDSSLLVSISLFWFLLCCSLQAFEFGSAELPELSLRAALVQFSSDPSTLPENYDLHQQWDISSLHNLLFI